MGMDHSEIDRMQMLGALRGCPLSVLLAMFMAHELGMDAVGETWLMVTTTYSDKPVARALRLLKAYGQVERKSRYEWALVKDASMLPLVAGVGKSDLALDASANANIRSMSESGVPELDEGGMEDLLIGESAADSAPGGFPADQYSQSRKVSESENLRDGYSPDWRKPSNLNISVPEFLRGGGSTARKNSGLEGGESPWRNSGLEDGESPVRKNSGLYDGESPGWNTENFRPSSSSSSRYPEYRFGDLLLPLVRANDPENFRTRAIPAGRKRHRAPPRRS
jgi:hypothetical protein